MYARWLAILASRGERSGSETIRQLDDLRQGTRRLDRIDDLEVLNAKVWLTAQSGAIDEEERQEMWQRLAEMPQGVAAHLRKLRMLEGPF
jgi:hypothetical protein